LNESIAADQWIYSLLKADATLGGIVNRNGKTYIYIDQPPQEKVGDPPIYPYVLFQMQSAVDVMWVGPRRVWSNMLYLVRGVHETGQYTGPLLTITERIDAVLHAKPDPGGPAASNAYGVVWACVGEQPFRLPEVQNGRNFRHFGRIYRIYASMS
jgi:hypothetical protein